MVRSFLPELEIDLLYDPAIALEGISPKDCVFYYGETGSSIFMVALFAVASKWKQPRCPE